MARCSSSSISSRAAPARPPATRSTPDRVGRGRHSPRDKIDFADKFNLDSATDSLSGVDGIGEVGRGRGQRRVRRSPALAQRLTKEDTTATTSHLFINNTSNIEHRRSARAGAAVLGSWRQRPQAWAGAGSGTASTNATATFCANSSHYLERGKWDQHHHVTPPPTLPLCEMALGH